MKKIECPNHKNETKTSRFLNPKWIRFIDNEREEWFCPNCGKFWFENI